MKDIKLPPLPEIDRWSPVRWGEFIGARRLNDGQYVAYEDHAQAMQAYAREAVRMNASQAVPPGWKLVPVEPTPEMRVAGKNTIKGADTTFEGMLAELAYRSMLAAAPTPPAQASGQSAADEIEGLRAHVALLKAALAQAERENDELRRAQPAAATAAPSDEEIEALALSSGLNKSDEHWGSRYYTELGSSLFRFARALLARYGRPAGDAEYPQAAKVCAELYQVIGSLASDLGVFDHPKVVKALDNAANHALVHDDVLPFPSFEHKTAGEA